MGDGRTWVHPAIRARLEGRLDDAIRYLRMELEVRPEHQEYRYTLARVLMQAGRFAEAWPLYEVRREMPRLEIHEPRADYPEWKGEDLAGKRLLVCGEAGLGDQLMFGRYLPFLRDRGADLNLHINIRHLARLFEFNGYRTSNFAPTQPAPPADYWVMLESTPLRLGLADLPPGQYLTSPVRPGGGIGVMARGNPAYSNDRHRSMFGDDEAELLKLGRSLAPEASGVLDFLDTAETMRGLDLVITVDTAMSHLAGALGVPCWVLLPYEGMDPRWGDGVTSPWHPRHRLFRQGPEGRWGPVLERVREALAHM